MSITFEKLTHIIELPENNSSRDYVDEVVRLNLYKYLVHSSHPLSLFISILLFSMCSNMFLTLSLLVLFISLITFFKIILKNFFYKRFYNWTLFFNTTQFTLACVLSQLSNVTIKIKIIVIDNVQIQLFTHTTLK